MTARDDAAHIAAQALAKALFVEVNGGELEHIATVYKPEGQAIVLRAAVLDALAAQPGLRAQWAIEDGELDQVGWVAPVRADGTITGQWWHYDLEARRPSTAVPVFRVADRNHTNKGDQ